MNQIDLTAEVVAHIGSFPVTNSILVTWIVIAILVVISYLSTRKVSLVPSGLQNIMESIVEVGYSTVENLAHSRTRVIFPIVMTFFLFITAGNLLGLVPGFGTVGFNQITNGKSQFVPLFRGANADLNTTLALALISAVATHVLSVRCLGVKNYLLRWVSLNPIFLFVGVLEIVSEFTKVVSLSFRLFGNIFAGEVLLGTVSTLFAFILPLPFYFLEIIVAVVQAAVFYMLSLVFMVLLTEKHPEGELA